MAKPNVNDPQWYSSFPKNEDGTPNMKKFQKEDFQKSPNFYLFHTKMLK